MELSITGNHLQPLGSHLPQGTSFNKGKTFFTYQLSANHRVIVGSGTTIPMWTEDTIYYGMDGSNQDVPVTLAGENGAILPVKRDC